MNWMILLGLLMAAALIFKHGERGRGMSKGESLAFMGVGFAMLIGAAFAASQLLG